MRAGQGPAQLVRASILRHLQAMCATRLGSMLVRPDYGLPAVSEMVNAFPNAIQELAAALEHTIKTYEPRLARVAVRHVPDSGKSLVICYEVTAEVVGGAGQPVHFTTTVDSSRRVSIT